MHGEGWENVFIQIPADYSIELLQPLVPQLLKNMRVYTNSSDRILDSVANYQLTRRGKSNGIQVSKV